ncbi:Fe-S metabolism associated domain protein [Bacteriovorax sp. BSW11_IV]|uniref:SufE family protein n=1 Tax=Bacteriovorax sp. BSW11_IV TaxID=1353529 RepID=UPI000389E123|nr:SufE family protein [Bacteriovorax sp. BSW11_IV]EQC46458.1 Fe-S metabolism associated domain protein [Bacteriovorax sp. BSW11_IV]
MEINARIEKLITEFKSFSDWEERYKYIIQLGKDLAPMDETHKVEANKVKGCQSQVWLFAHLNNGVITFEADSDAAIVKGIVSILVRIYSGSTPAEILATKPDFLDDIGLRQHLSMSRANGLTSMVKQISMYALAYDTKLKMGLA